jgi:lipoprotein-anchoring transpeptidase ErfK/SrfK
MIHRRTLLSGAAALAAAATVAPGARAQEQTPYVIPEEHMPRMVRIKGAVQPFEIHVVPDEFALYWTLPEGRAIRYAVGIGREGLYEWGNFYVGAKKEWPEWTPTPEMIARDPASYER